MSVRILVGDCRGRLAELPDASVQTCVTSPPYFGLRDYGHAGQMGLEATPDAYVVGMVAVFREVRRVLKDDGTLWLNLGDSYVSAGGLHDGREDNRSGVGAKRVWRDGSGRADGIVDERGQRNRNGTSVDGIPPKNLIGIPWRVAFALQADGWYLRSDIIWHKPNPMPESVTDRPTKSHEYLFLLAKSERYYYDAEAIKEPAEWTRENNPDWAEQRAETNAKKGAGNRNAASAGFTKWDASQGRNKRDVWTVATKPYAGAHFATFPTALIEPCILAGSAKGDTVLDPFGGAGTTGLVADRLGRDAILCELNPDYAAMAERRIHEELPMFAQVDVL